MKKSFNLIEALAALSILSLVSVILLPAIYNSITANSKKDDSYKMALELQGIVENYKAEHFNNKPHETYEDCLITEKISAKYKTVKFTYLKDEKSLEFSLILPTDISRYKQVKGEKDND